MKFTNIMDFLLGDVSSFEQEIKNLESRRLGNDFLGLGYTILEGEYYFRVYKFSIKRMQERIIKHPINGVDGEIVSKKRIQAVCKKLDQEYDYYPPNKFGEPDFTCFQNESQNHSFIL